MTWTERRGRLRGVLAGQDCVYPASVFDPASARIAESLGFELGMIAGSIASFATLGAPDIVLITLSELTNLVGRISQASRLPLVIDADHGYGNAINVMRTVRDLETAGISGITIEDTILPAVYGTRGKAGLIPLDEGIGKMRAALAARTDPALVIIGRSSALSMGGLDEAITRFRAYEAAGVDAIFIAGVQSMEQIAAIAAAVRLPLLLGAAKADLIMQRAALAAHNVRVCLQGHLPYLAAVKAVHDTLAALRNGAPPDQVGGAASAALMKLATQADDYDRWAKDFLGL
jgi:carboxyvinyl-carboxyphosphonate phosphorylmutase